LKLFPVRQYNIRYLLSKIIAFLFFYVAGISYIYYVINETITMKVSQLVKLLRNGSAEEIKEVFHNRKLVNQSKVRFLMSVKDHGVRIEEIKESQSTWYYIWRPIEGGRENLASQFYWNEGEYDAEGNHSLYDEYGFAL